MVTRSVPVRDPLLGTLTACRNAWMHYQPVAWIRRFIDSVIDDQNATMRADGQNERCISG